MNQTQLPRSLLIVLFILVVLTFFVGTLRTFSQAYAATFIENPAQKADLPSANGITPTSSLIADFPSPGPTPTPPPTSVLPPPTDEETSLPTPAPTPTPMITVIPNPRYGDTTGIIAMGILLMVVILIGMASGGRNPRMTKEPRK